MAKNTVFLPRNTLQYRKMLVRESRRATRPPTRKAVARLRPRTCQEVDGLGRLLYPHADPLEESPVLLAHAKERVRVRAARNPLDAADNDDRRSGNTLVFIEVAFQDRASTGFSSSRNGGAHRDRREGTTIPSPVKNSAGEDPIRFDNVNLIIVTPDRALVHGHINLLSVVGESLSDKKVPTEVSKDLLSLLRDNGPRPRLEGFSRSARLLFQHSTH